MTKRRRVDDPSRDRPEATAARAVAPGNTAAEEQRLVTDEMRRAAEELREAAEQMRLTGEQMRREAEAIRQAHEAMRQAAEEARRIQEQLRQASEQARVAAERLRQEREAERRVADESGDFVGGSTPAAQEIGSPVGDRAVSHPSAEWVERVSRAMVQAGEIVRAAMASHKNAERLVSSIGRKGRKPGSGDRPEPRPHAAEDQREATPRREDPVVPASAPDARDHQPIS
jgi:membrane protein involved in colicin uptake